MKATDSGLSQAFDQRGRLIFERVFTPSTFIERSRGLLGRPPPCLHDAWWFRACWAIHTFGMRFPIDVLHLAEDGSIVRISASVKPSRISACPKATQVVELHEGAAALLDLGVGTRLEMRR